MTGTEWKELRALTSEADTGPAVDAIDWDTMLATGRVKPGHVNAYKSGGLWFFRAYGKGSTGDTIRMAVWAARQEGGDFALVFVAKFTLGATPVPGMSGYYFAEAVTIEYQPWPRDVVAENGEHYVMGTGATANAGVATVAVDSLEAARLIGFMESVSGATEWAAEFAQAVV
ncbi:hypothetical protein STSP2_03162 [Anaerohalosphaera lusitana]|uniref:Uncharacterized protein n=1 Tax=Anaerohalosphaera lusitana TaxID=1936003 RepID=A0A1U9NPV1_9BACT|nr:hypothetical protein [Anaerohalosphaera lusitana]AQT69962.1 hypothetical protein STSP2_03162 [Anaerohalosphaera lusitana]